MLLMPLAICSRGEAICRAKRTMVMTVPTLTPRYTTSHPPSRLMRM